jgi:diguanylate cyclase (GGDEF)-like protein/PAS domain S-box-containing protein
MAGHPHGAALAAARAEALLGVARLDLPADQVAAAAEALLAEVPAGPDEEDDSSFRAQAAELVAEAVARRRREDVLAADRRHLVAAQRISRVGSYDFELATNTNSWSDELYRIYGREPQSFHASYEVFLEMLHPMDRAHVVDVHQQSLQTLEPYEMEERVIWPDGQVRTLASWGEIVLGEDGRPARMVGICWDITDRREMEAQLVRQSMHDHLTGLPNRALLLDRLSQALGRLDAHPAAVALLLLDVDRFSVVNDSLGHDAGDELLTTLAARLSEALRPGDTLARLGGDEFVLLCPDLGPPEQAELLASTVADELQALLREPVLLGTTELVVTASLGVAITSIPGSSPGTLLRDADAALNRAKDGGRARAVVFEPGMRTAAVGRLDTERELRRALRRHELRVHYQPVVHLESGALRGFEALVRWQHPERGLLLPGDFVDVAEETGLIVPIGAWVLEQACRQLAVWQQAAGPHELVMAVNLSGVQVAEPGLVPLLHDVLARTGVSPPRLVLEITESVLMQDPDEVLAVLQGIRDCGVRLAVDDFGTGWSSLSYLRRYPVDVLKLDRSFVSGVDRSPDAAALARAVLGMADALGLASVAEGIETEAELAELVAMGFALGQGWWFARALPPEELDGLVSGADGVDGERPVVRPV